MLHQMHIRRGSFLLCQNQGRNERGQGGRDSLGAELLAALILSLYTSSGVISEDKKGTISLAPNHYGGAGKSQQCHKYFLQYSTFAY